MILIILIVLAIALTICLYNSYCNTSEIEYYFKNGKLHDTIYFKVIDEHGKISYLHDSGKNPKTLKKFTISTHITAYLRISFSLPNYSHFFWC